MKDIPTKYPIPILIFPPFNGRLKEGRLNLLSWLGNNFQDLLENKLKMRFPGALNPKTLILVKKNGTNPKLRQGFRERDATMECPCLANGEKWNMKLQPPFGYYLKSDFEWKN